MQVGFKCQYYGNVSHEECRDCSIDPLRHKCMYSSVMLEHMREKKDPEREGIFSPTQLTDCFRKSELLKDEDYYADPEDLWAMERGNIFHSYLRELPYPGALESYIEKRLYLDVQTRYGQARLGGKPDLVAITKLENGLAQAKIIDWKSTNELKHDYTSPYDDHVIQLNCYKLLVEEALSTGEMQLHVIELELNAISMVRPRRFTSVQELTTRGKIIKRSQPKEYETLTLSKIPILSNEEIRAWVVERIEQKIEASQNLPPIIPEGSPDKWRCSFCPVKSKCYGLEEGEIHDQAE